MRNIKFPFEGMDLISRNYSQAHQDLFVLCCLNGKRDGLFLEVGALHGEFISNTCLLERTFNWKGISIDIEENVRETFKNRPNTNLVIADAIEIDYKKLLSENGYPNRIDYLQLDIEPSEQTLECLKKIPLNDYRFSVITYETDFYQGSDRELALRIKNESRNILESYGYELIIGDVCCVDSHGQPFEDWYVDPQVIPQETINKLKSERDSGMYSHQYILN